MRSLIWSKAASHGAAMLMLVILSVSGLAQSDVPANLKEWREQRVKALLADDGWLSVVNLFWLKEGPNTIGTATASNFVLPRGSAPANVGTFELKAGKVRFEASRAAGVRLNDEEVTSVSIDPAKPQQVFRVRNLSFSLIKRGDRFAVRLRDRDSLQRRRFRDIDSFPENGQFRVTADYIPYPEPKELLIVNVIGDVIRMKSPGKLVFNLGGGEFQLDPVIEGEKLFIVFRDQTTGKCTYPGGRFLYARPPLEGKPGKVTLDFNQAINPPCAFTAFATCPLPPKQNNLPIPIEAGELTYHLK